MSFFIWLKLYENCVYELYILRIFKINKKRNINLTRFYVLFLRKYSSLRRRKKMMKNKILMKRSYQTYLINIIFC